MWEVTPVFDTATKLRISISRKNKQTGEYEQDFSGYVTCVGSAAAQKALKLKEGDRIKLGDCDVSTKYDAQKKVTYTNYKLFDFSTDENVAPRPDPTRPTVDDGEVDDNLLPF